MDANDTIRSDPQANAPHLVVIIVPSVLSAILVLVIIGLLFYLNKRGIKFSLPWGFCCNKSHFDDVEGLIGGEDWSDFDEDEQDIESGYVETTVSTSDDTGYPNPNRSEASTTLSLSSQLSQCSYYSIPEEQKSLYCISTGVYETSPAANEEELVTPTQDEPKFFDFQDNAIVSLVLPQETRVGINSFPQEGLESPTNGGGDKKGLTLSKNQPLHHFEDFENFAKYCANSDPTNHVPQAPQRQPLPILEPILQNVRRGVLSSYSHTTQPSPSQSQQDEKDASPMCSPSRSPVCKRKRRLQLQSDSQNQDLFPPTSPSKIRKGAESAKAKQRQLSTTKVEQDLWLQQNDLIKRVNEGETFLAPNVRLFKNSLELLRILREIVLHHDLQESPFFDEDMLLSPFSVKNAVLFLQELQDFPQFVLDHQTQFKQLIRLSQKLILSQHPKHMMMQSELIIGVDATPTVFGGYCINLYEKKIEYYMIKKKDLPWKIEQKFCTEEFEMKNFLFALCVWSEQIEKYKTFSAYTDNNAVVAGNNKYGTNVNKLVRHFVDCKGANRTNASMFINRRMDLESFSKFIQPADDLSRGQLQKCTEILCKLYMIENNTNSLFGTHTLPPNCKKNKRRKAMVREFLFF